MGNNQAFTDFEFFTIACYNAGVLDKKLLKKFIAHYDGVNIDSGGRAGLVTRDGLEIEEVVVKVVGGTLPKKPTKRPSRSQELPEWEEYREALWDEFSKHTSGWR